ncbi:FecCD family ABC transporter permease [Pseudoroseicyclus sp. CXY001]|uniref:FecCD family ABC transporter permease n=1 Tax=Pseudoroseicyclus sp. CXY001 TaxID=3242492 RepID=UPI00358DD8C7
MSRPPITGTLTDTLAAARRQRGRRRAGQLAALAAVVLALVALTLMVGQSVTPPGDVARVLLGRDVPGAGFTIGTLRAPRALMSLLTGLSFGLAGAAFQTMLRNPLASPDIIGISFGASGAAVAGIVFFGLSGSAVAPVAIAGGLGVALGIYALAWRGGGVAGARLILIGIGMAAMMQSVISYSLLKASTWSQNEAIRWMAGSVNGATLAEAVPLALALAVCGGVLLLRARDLEALRLGDDTAAALGIRVGWLRITVLLAAVGLVAFATAAAGPIAFVAFLSGPIVSRLIGPGRSLLLPAALGGAVLVLGADWIGQFALPMRFPVGIVTGALGAPWLVYLIARSNRVGAAS